MIAVHSGIVSLTLFPNKEVSHDKLAAIHRNFPDSQADRKKKWRPRTKHSRVETKASTMQGILT